MRPIIYHRFWILISWYITIQCILGYQQQISNVTGQHLLRPEQIESHNMSQADHHLLQHSADDIRPNSDGTRGSRDIESNDDSIMYFDDAIVGYQNPTNLKIGESRVPSLGNGNNVNAVEQMSARGTHGERSHVSYSRKTTNEYGETNDNNVEGGGDKEFYTEEFLYLSTKRYRNARKSARYRRSVTTTAVLPTGNGENQYNNSVQLPSVVEHDPKQQQQQQQQHVEQHHQKQLSISSYQTNEPLPHLSSSLPQTPNALSASPAAGGSSVVVVVAAAAAAEAADAISTVLPQSPNSRHQVKIPNPNSAIVNANIAKHSYPMLLDSVSDGNGASSDIRTNISYHANINYTTTSDAISSRELNVIENSNPNSNEQIIIISNGDGEKAAAAAAARRRVSKAALRRSKGSSGDALRNSSVNGVVGGGVGGGGGGGGGGDGAGDFGGRASDDNADKSNRNDDMMMGDEPKVLPLRPIIRGPYDDDHQGEMTVVYAEPHTEIKLNCEVDLDIMSNVWMKDGQMVHTTDRHSRPTDNRFIRELRGGLTITNAMLEDDGKWQCEAENARGYVENARPVKLVVLDRPKPPYLLIDSRRLDAGNIFVPVKESSELSLACVTEGGNPKPTLTWEVLLSPGVERHAQKVAAELLELQEFRSDKDKVSSAVKSEARMPAVFRAHHNARILCVMEHPTLKMRQNASILLDVQYTPSFAISRTPGFGYPLREGIEVSLKCDVDSNPPSTPLWQKDDTDTPVSQDGDGFLNFTAIRREHSGWYKCTSRHLNFQYSSIGYYLSVRYDSVDVTSEPLEQDISAAASHLPNKRPQLEVQLGGAVTLQCPQGSLGCWSHLDPVTAKLRGLGMGLTTPTGQFSLKDVVYQDAGIYKCIGQSVSNNKKKVEIIHTVAVQVKGQPTVSTRNNTPIAYPGSPLHLSVEFCANPPAFAARWLHGDRVYTPGNQYGIDVLAYGVIDLPTPFCKEARLTYVHMHERVPRTFYFIVSSPGGVAETIFHVNFTLRHKVMSNSIDDDEEELSEPEEIHFPVFGAASSALLANYYNYYARIAAQQSLVLLLLSYFLCI